MRSPPDGFDEKELCLITKQWLESKASGRWMLVIDDLNVADDQLRVFVEQILPRTKGHIIITTQYWDRTHTSLVFPGYDIPVQEMELDEARQLFKRLTPSDGMDWEDVDKLLDTLGHIPEAIRLAAGYIHSTGIGLLDYMRQLPEASAHSKHLSDSSVGAAPLLAIQKAWQISFQRLEYYNEPAARLLQSMSFLSASKVPKDLLVASDDVVHLSLRDLGIVKSHDYYKAIRALLGFNFIDIDTEEVNSSTTYRLHSAVSECSRRWAQKHTAIEHTVYKVAINSAARAFMAQSFHSFQICTPKFKAAYRLLPYGTNVLSFRPASTNHLEHIHCTTMDLQYEIAKTFYFAGAYDTARRHLLNACMGKPNVAISASKETKFCMARAMIEKEIGLYECSLEHLKRASQILESQAVHEPTVIKDEIQINMANVLRNQGKYREADRIYTKLLRSRGPEEDMTDETSIYLRSCYGNSLSAQGEFTKAIEIFQITLKAYRESSKKRFGDSERDENIYYTLASIAVAQHHTRSPNEAAINFEQAIKGMEDLHCENHPKALLMRLNQAEAIAAGEDSSRISEALQQMDDVLRKFTELSDECEHTLSARHRIGVIHSRISNHSEALTHFDSVLQVRKEREKLGEQLPIQYYITVFSRADVYKEQGDYDRALAGYKEAEDGLKRICDSDHHTVLFHIKLGRAEFPQFLGDYATAKKLLLRAHDEALIDYGQNSSQELDVRERLKALEDMELQTTKPQRWRSCAFFGRHARRS